MSDVMTFSKRTAAGLEEVLRALLLDSENKVPADRLRIVGALDDGAIIESGSNANGGWVRLANGTQWCFASIVTTVTQRELSFPAAFITGPILAFTSSTNFGDQTGYNTMVYSIARSETGFSCKVEYQNQIYTGTVGISYIAIGKWK